MKKERSSFTIWKQNLFFSERERQMRAQMQVARPPQLSLEIVRIWLILDQALSVKPPKLILTALMPFAQIFLCTAFCTHLHTDHTAGYADLIFTPWVLERETPLKVFGPKGLQHMTDHILEAYATDIDFRIQAENDPGYRYNNTHQCTGGGCL